MSHFLNVIKSSLGITVPTGRQVAKERLSIMLVHQRNLRRLENIDMESLQEEVAAVVQKYIKVSQQKASQISVKQEGELDILEMHFPMDSSINKR